MELIAATVDMMKAEVDEPELLGKKINARMPDSGESGQWPPAMAKDAIGLFYMQLKRDPDLAGWLCWYLVHVDSETGKRTLIGSAGFTSRPVNGAVAIGYSLLPQYYGKGYATEAVRALSDWAFDHPEVNKIIAEVFPENKSSIGVLEKSGFVPVGQGEEEGALRYERKRSDVRVKSNPGSGR